MLGQCWYWRRFMRPHFARPNFFWWGGLHSKSGTQLRVHSIWGPLLLVHSLRRGRGWPGPFYGAFGSTPKLPHCCEVILFWPSSRRRAQLALPLWMILLRAWEVSTKLLISLFPKATCGCNMSLDTVVNLSMTSLTLRPRWKRKIASSSEDQPLTWQSGEPSCLFSGWFLQSDLEALFRARMVLMSPLHIYHHSQRKSTTPTLSRQLVLRKIVLWPCTWAFVLQTSCPCIHFLMALPANWVILLNNFKLTLFSLVDCKRHVRLGDRAFASRFCDCLPELSRGKEVWSCRSTFNSHTATLMINQLFWRHLTSKSSVLNRVIFWRECKRRIGMPCYLLRMLRAPDAHIKNAKNGGTTLPISFSTCKEIYHYLLWLTPMPNLATQMEPVSLATNTEKTNLRHSSEDSCRLSA